MESQELLYKLLEQTPLVIALVLGIWYFTKQIETQGKAHRKAIVAKDKEIAKMNESYLGIVTDNTAAMVKMLTLFDEMRNDIKDVKNGD